MFKYVLALSLLSFNALASVEQTETTILPFGFDTGYVDSERNVGYDDTIIRLIADIKPIQVYDITVDDDECRPYKKIPKHYVVAKGTGFNLRFYAINGKDCLGMQFRIKTDQGEFIVDSGEE